MDASVCEERTQRRQCRIERFPGEPGDGCGVIASFGFDDGQDSRLSRGQRSARSVGVADGEQFEHIRRRGDAGRRVLAEEAVAAGGGGIRDRARDRAEGAAQGSRVAGGVEGAGAGAGLDDDGARGGGGDEAVALPNRTMYA